MKNYLWSLPVAIFCLQIKLFSTDWPANEDCHLKVKLSCSNNCTLGSDPHTLRCNLFQLWWWYVRLRYSHGTRTEISIFSTVVRKLTHYSSVSSNVIQGKSTSESFGMLVKNKAKIQNLLKFKKNGFKYFNLTTVHRILSLT